MNTSIILIAAGVLGICGIALGLLIALAVKIFKVNIDPRIEAVTDLLPGANCGGCGTAGCSDFAKAVVEGRLSPNNCPVSSQEIRSSIARALGIEIGAAEKMVAVVMCGGSHANAKTVPLYNGVSDCISASMVGGGPKSCAYGCLGFSSCARACPFGAIEMVDGLAIVHAERCVGCGKCVATCPRHLIKLVPAATKFDIYCSSPAKAPLKRSVCSVACLGCRKCAKSAPDFFKPEGFKVSVNYEQNPEAEQPDIAAIGCPTGCLAMRDAHRAQIASGVKK